MKRRICNLLLTAVLCLLLAVPVCAAEQGSLLLKEVEHPAEIFVVADAQGIPTGAFADTVEKLTRNDLTPAAAKVFYERVQSAKPSGVTVAADQSKKIFFSSLEEGWYLVCSKGEQAEFAPFLVAIPMRINSQSVYAVEAEPKVDSPVTPPTSSKPSTPVTPEPNIPQTGVIQWPKYVLLILGAAAIGVGLVQVIAGQEKRYE